MNPDVLLAGVIVVWEAAFSPGRPLGLGGCIVGLARGAGLAAGEREALHVSAAALLRKRYALVFGQLVFGVHFIGEALQPLIRLIGAGPRL